MTAIVRSRSEFLRARGLRHHVRCWGNRSASKVFLGHGFLDVSATFQPMVEAFLQATDGHWQVLAPDWRGFGYTEWPQDGYWFHDYVADLDAILDHFAPANPTADEPLTLIGHSMGSEIMSLYAGLKPERVAKLVILDGISMPAMAASSTPRRFRRWLDELREPPKLRSYPSFEDLAGRVRRQHPQISEDQSLFIAHCWGRQDGRGRITLCADPKHRLNGPRLYRSDESEAVWREVTAQTLFIEAGKTQFGMKPDLRAERLACFRDRRVETLPGAGHMLHFDAPRETAALIAGFLSR